MRSIPKLPVAGNLDEFPLFRWATDRAWRARPLSVAATTLARRYRLPLHRAALVAALAGLGDGGRDVA